MFGFDDYAEKNVYFLSATRFGVFYLFIWTSFI